MENLDELESFIEIYKNSKLIGFNLEVEYDEVNSVLFLTYGDEVFYKKGNITKQNYLELKEILKNNDKNSHFKNDEIEK